jgi:hypothetical protein
MGVFKGLRQINQRGNENFARMEAEADAMTFVSADQARPPSISASDAIEATAMVVRFAQTNTVERIDPVVELDLVAIAPGKTPRPLTIRPALSLGRTARVQRGASIPVTLSRSDPAAAIINWSSDE